MKNLKCYERLLKEKTIKARKRSNFKVKLVSLSLAVTLLLSACSLTNNTNRRDTVPSTTPSYSSQQTTSPTVDAAQEEVITESEIDRIINSHIENSTPEQESYYQGIYSQNISFSAINNTAVQSSINNINVQYPYTNISSVETAYNRYQQMQDFVVSPIDQKIISGKLTADELALIVIENNKNYRENNRFVSYGDLDIDYIKKVCAVICENLPKVIESLDTDDILDDVTSTISSLCIFKSATGNNASITGKNCLLVTPFAIDNMGYIADNDEAFEITILHELIHLMSKMSIEAEDEIGATEAYGFCFSFPELAVNSLYYNWFLEASAEIIASDMYDSDPMIYQFKIGYLNTLTLVNSFDNNFKVDDLPELTLQQDIEKLFSTFGVTSHEDKMELLNALYAIEVIQEESPDFFAEYEKQLGRKVTDEDVTEVKRDLKQSFCQTITKYFYSNLSEKLGTTKMSVEDIFKIMTIFEIDLNMHILYEDGERIEKTEQFMESYLEIQGEFLEQVASQLGLGVDEVKEAYTSYFMNFKMPKTYAFFADKNETTEQRIMIFDEIKNEFLTKLVVNLEGSRSVTVEQAYNAFQNTYTH
jgi:hypothetical protein